jgi:hypothetical protein
MYKYITPKIKNYLDKLTLLHLEISWKTRLKITLVLTRVHVLICTQGSKCCYCRKDVTKLPAKVWNAVGRPLKSLQFCRPKLRLVIKLAMFLQGCRIIC